MNRVRAGIVEHPRDWRWCGYDELVGTRRRYCLIDLQGLVRRLDLKDVKDLARLHAEGIQDLITRRLLKREPLWSESLAVGSLDYVQRIKKEYWQRTRFEEECVQQEDHSQARTVREATPDAYVADSGPESPV